MPRLSCYLTIDRGERNGLKPFPRVFAHNRIGIRTLLISLSESLPITVSSDIKTGTILKEAKQRMIYFVTAI